MPTISRLLQTISNERVLPWVGALVSGLIATWVMFKTHELDTINSDGILYIEVAKQFAAGNWHEAITLYKWPFYPLLIAVFHQFSGFGLETSAHILDALFFVFMTAGLMMLVREVGGDRVTMLAVAGLLWTSSAIVRSYLPMVLRDPGYWAIHVWSILFFIRFYLRQEWRYALGWGIAASLATLLRIEGIVYFLMLPLVLLIQNKGHGRIPVFIKANTVLLVTGVFVAALLVMHPSLQLNQLGRLSDPISVSGAVYHQFSHGLHEKARIFSDQILGKFLADYAIDGLLLTLVYAVIVKAGTAAGWIPLALGVSSLKLPVQHRPATPVVFGWLLALGLITSLFIILSTFVLPKRYVMPIGLVILVYAAFALAYLYRQWQAWKFSGRNIWFPLVASLVILNWGMVLGGWANQRNFELEAVEWISMHAKGRVYYDSGRLRYYANADEPFGRGQATAEEIQKLVESDSVRQYEYLLIHISRNQEMLEQFVTARLGPPVTVFENGRSKRLLIYRVSPG